MWAEHETAVRVGKRPGPPDGSRPAVLFVSPFSPLRVGGVAQFLIDVGAQLTSEGLRIGFLHAGEPAAVELPASLGDVPRIEVPTRGPRALRTVLIVLRTVTRAMSTRNGFAVYHALVPVPLTATAIALARVFGRRAVATIFAPYPKDPNPLAEAAQRLAERLTLLLADEVVYECEATQRRFPRRGVVILNGIDTSYFRPSEERRHEVRTRLGIPEDTIVFLYTGRITELKGVRDLVDAFQGLDPSLRAKALLLLVGPIETKDPDSVLPTRRPGSDRIHHLPPVGRYEIRDYYQAADVFVLPSYWEGISSALVEAMACGLPAVVSNVGGSPEVVVDRRSGLLHDAGDVAGLRARLAETIESPDLRRSMGREARIRIETRFDLRGMVRRYREVYERVLGHDAAFSGRGRPRP